MDSEAILNKERLENAHIFAFPKVCQRLENEILHEKWVLKSTDLLRSYITVIGGTDCPNSVYRSEDLKAKLEHKFKQ